MLLFLRCTTFIGVCVEFVAAVAWLAELFPDPKQREAVLGYTQAFSSVGGLLVSAAYTLLATYSASLPAVTGGHQPWRYTLISGVVPAIPLIIIRPFLPESPVWQEKKAAGTLQAPELRASCSGRNIARRRSDGADVRVQLRRGVRRHPADAAHRARTCRKWRTSLAAVKQAVVSKVQFLQEMGGLVGRCILAVLAVQDRQPPAAAARSSRFPDCSSCRSCSSIRRRKAWTWCRSASSWPAC